jgi:DNA-directed RNA polymerase specialized sigma24 family protein
MRAGLRRVGTFPSTDWRLVFASRRHGTTRTRDSLAELCETYWYPIYAFLRRRHHQADEAEDLTQAFFTHVLATGLLSRAQPEKGRLRSLLLASLTNFVANDRKRRSARKRRDIARILPEVADAEARYLREPADHVTPERLYERQWAAALLTRVLDQLRDELARSGRDRLFDGLKEHLVGDGDETAYRAAASALDLSPGAARVAAHRLRRRYRALLRAEIARTVGGSESEVDDEIRYLFSVTQPC